MNSKNNKKLYVPKNPRRSVSNTKMLCSHLPECSLRGVRCYFAEASLCSFFGRTHLPSYTKRNINDE